MVMIWQISQHITKTFRTLAELDALACYPLSKTLQRLSPFAINQSLSCHDLLFLESLPIWQVRSFLIERSRRQFNCGCHQRLASSTEL
jgi:hypothetical protein